MATILTIDDSASIRQVLKFTLENAGHKVIEAKDGVEALNKLERKEGFTKIDIIVSDVNMPNMDGITFLKTLKSDEQYSQYKFAPVIMLTTEGSDDMKQAGRSGGAKAWITKPFAPEQILKVIEKLIPS